MLKMLFQRVTKPITEPVCKLGGRPVGLDDDDWPSCKTCNTPMAFVMQIPMGPAGPIKAEEEGLIYLFICNNPDLSDECKTADPDAGDNAVIVRMMDDLLEGEALVPEDSNGMKGEYLVRFEETAWPAKCEKCGKPAAEGEAACPACSSFYAFYSRIGGLPPWLGEDETPFDKNGEPMEFAALLNWDVGDRGLNMAQFGTGFLFLSKDKKSGKFLYQS